jgi:DNA-binding MarR family transcriptional regulator
MEVIPDPTSAASGYDYLFAHSREFAERSDLLVMVYLWTYTWRKYDTAMGAELGFVLSGKASVTRIASATGLSRTTVNDAIDRLRAGGWIETEQRIPGNWRAGQDIWVKLDPQSHEARQALYA